VAVWLFVAFRRGRGPKTRYDQEYEEPLGTVEFRVSCTVKHRNRSPGCGAAAFGSLTKIGEAFRKAGNTDPRCAMAHWGLAMTEYHQLWEPYAGPAE